ncbi:hypothetical protein C0J52_26124, partial [Blattella germanica]
RICEASQVRRLIREISVHEFIIYSFESSELSSVIDLLLFLHVRTGHTIPHISLHSLHMHSSVTVTHTL